MTTFNRSQDVTLDRPAMKPAVHLGELANLDVADLDGSRLQLDALLARERYQPGKGLQVRRCLHATQNHERAHL